MEQHTDSQSETSKQKRLLKIFWATEFALLALLIFFTLIGSFDTLGLMIIIIMGLLYPVYYHAKHNNIQKGGSFLLWLLTIVFCYFMWAHDGIRDETLFCFPAIICFAALLSNKRLLIYIFAFTVCNILAIGLANEFNWITHPNTGSTLQAAILIITIFSVIAFTINIIVNELTDTYHKLKLNQLELEDKVLERTNELEQSLMLLTESQHQLVEAQKMASLGRMVAGVAHEINTPIGVGITASSYGVEKAVAFEKLFTDGNISKSQLQKFIQDTKEGFALISTNLDRAALLIDNFKKTAVEQSNENLSEFDLNQHIKEVIGSLSPMLARAKAKITFDMELDNIITIYSSYGTLSQVFVNLINNSILHGFDHKDSGTITINTELQDNNIFIYYRDDGVGMSEDVLAQIFEPFYTTKRDQGGSGLGMHIVYNLITNSLKGAITCNSKINEGVEFVIKIPVSIKHAD